MPTVALKTLGCKLNQYETEAIRAALEDGGFDAVPFDAPADVYVLNTCTVTGRSDYKSRQLARRICRDRPDAVLVVTGCYAEVAPDVFRALGPRVRVVPNQRKNGIAALLGGAAEGAASRRPTRFAGKTRFFLKVQEGCDHACAYCAVRTARGPSRSRPAADVVADLDAAVAGGVKEVVLVGVDLGAYGRDLAPPSSLARLVAALAERPGDFRLRLSSVDVADLDDDLVGLLADGPLCPHVHLPLQSADDRVLRAMRRRYRAADYRRGCDALFARCPDVAVGADVIAGLPGEDEAAFEATASLLRAYPFAYLHVFPYSAREGTDAAAAPAQVAASDRERRAAALRELAVEKRRAYERRFDGAERPALVENGAEALTDNYLHVALDDYAGPANVFVRLRLAAGARGLRGRVAA